MLIKLFFPQSFLNLTALPMFKFFHYILPKESSYFKLNQSSHCLLTHFPAITVSPAHNPPKVSNHFREKYKFLRLALKALYFLDHNKLTTWFSFTVLHCSNHTPFIHSSNTLSTFPLQDLCNFSVSASNVLPLTSLKLCFLWFRLLLKCCIVKDIPWLPSLK